MNLLDYSEREIGWLVTVDHTEPSQTEARVGWGQLQVHATETELSFDRPAQHTIFMDKSLTEHMIPEDQRVRWRSFDDDWEQCYDGLVRITWIFRSVDGLDLAYNIDRFNMTDAGAVRVFYSVDDIVACAKGMEMPEWQKFAENHSSQKQFLGYEGNWIEIYS